MTAADFRRIALSLSGAEEGSHMGSADFRVGGRIFATLASQSKGYGNLMLTPELQADFVAEQPGVSLAAALANGMEAADGEEARLKIFPREPRALASGFKNTL